MQLSVVLSTLGNYDGLRRVLDGYEGQDAPSSSFEVLLVCDRAEPDPESVDLAIGDRPYRVTRLQGRIPGLSANRNAGWQAATAPIVLFTDNDTIPVPELVSEHLRSHREHPAEETAVAGVVRWAEGLKVTPFMRWLERGVQFDFGSIPGDQASWAHLYGANSSVKRTMLERVGGFDEERLPYGYEDLDWGYRAREHGLRVILNRRAIVDHLRVMTVRDWQARAPRLAISEWRFCELHPNVEPWFFTMFDDAARRRPPSAALAWLARLIPESTPILGRRVWYRAGLRWRQQIAPYFLSAWNDAKAGVAPSVQPAVSAFAERSASSGGAPSGGPK